MELMTIYYLAVAEYSCGSYGAGSYNNSESCTTDTNSGGGTTQAPVANTSTGGTLASTGYDVVIPVALGLAILVAAAVLAIKKHKQAHK